MDQEWSAGDKVKLATGGPDMTVSEQTNVNAIGPQVVCHWFKDDEVKEFKFRPGELVRVGPA
jgi:uncharacterized protein YodC (DUF2158 family)